MMLTVWVLFIFAFSAFIHTTAGFGSALIAMALLVPLIGLSVAAPLVALISLPLQLVILWKYSEQLSFSAVRDILVMLFIGTPIGIWGLAGINENVLLTVLGVLILVYVVYTASGKQQIRLSADPRWAILFGLGAGILNGAYNSGGPVIVVYYKARGYDPDQFRCNVQTTFVAATIFVILSHLLQGNVTDDILGYFVVALPGTIIGVGVGLWVARYINQAMFHWLVLGLLALLGINLLLN